MLVVVGDKLSYRTVGRMTLMSGQALHARHPTCTAARVLPTLTRA